MEDYVASNPTESQQTQEVYAAFHDRLRTFKESRVLNNSKQLSCGYYPLPMIKSKGKSKGRQRGKGKSFGKSSSTTPSTSHTVLAAFQKEDSERPLDSTCQRSQGTMCFGFDH